MTQAFSSKKVNTDCQKEHDLAQQRGARLSPPQSSSLQRRERCESKKRQDKPAWADKEDWEVRAEQPAMVSTTPSSNSSEVEWRRSRAGGVKRFTCVSLHPIHILPAIPNKGGGGLQWPPWQGKDWLPHLWCLPRLGSEGKEMCAKRGRLQPPNIQLGSTTTKRKLEMSQWLGHGHYQGT